MDNAVFYNSLPPGMDIVDQENIDARRMGVNLAGRRSRGARGDRAQDINPESLLQGFDRKGMLTTDDEYTNAHRDAFYDEIEVDGDVGFAERNNYLDRL
jgi:hypothetical protein